MVYYMDKNNNNKTNFLIYMPNYDWYVLSFVVNKQ